MDIIIQPSSLGGAVPAVASKSMAHRLMILRAFAANDCELACTTTSADIEATRRCLDALVCRKKGNPRDGLASDSGDHDGALISNLQSDPTGCAHSCGSEIVLDCGESGSTLRFLLPVVGALGKRVRMKRHGRLAQRPLAPLDAQLRAHGMRIWDEGDDLVAEGQLHGGSYSLPGDVSSQYVSGLLMAAPLLPESLELFVSSPIQSRPYINMTIDALEQFGVEVVCDKVGMGTATCERFALSPTPLTGPARIEVEGDWSNAAFWLTAGAMEQDGVTVTGLDLTSFQGDRAVLAALAAFGARIARQGNAARATRDMPRPASFDVGAFPDLVPPLSVLAAMTPGTSSARNAGRLRLKESDRLATIACAINALGGKAHIANDDLVVEGVERLSGGTVDSANDHRIAMMAAIMATHAAGPVRIVGAECVEKSYPGFWDDYRMLGGIAQEATTADDTPT